MDPNTEMNQAIAELAYAMALTDGVLHKEEKKAFFAIIKSELGEYADAAKVRFQLLDEITQPNMNEAYQDAMDIIVYNKDYLTDELRDKFMRVIKRVAEAYQGIEAAETGLLLKFSKELDALK